MAPLSSSASNVRRQRAPAPAAAATTALKAPRAPAGAERSRLSAVPFLRRCRRLFRLPHRAKAAAILVHPSIAARGATQAAAAGAARWPHHLKRQERGREPRCVEGLGSRQEEGAELPRWRERRVRRRRNAGRAGDGPGLPRAPLHAPSYERWAVCASVAPCVRHQPSSGTRKWRGARLRRACGPALCPPPAERLESRALSLLGSCPRGSVVQPPGHLSLGLSRGSPSSTSVPSGGRCG